MALRVVEGASLRRFNTFGVEARAARLIELARLEDLQPALEALAGSPRRLVVAGGSNILFTGDFDGTVLLVRTRGFRVLADEGDTVVVESEAGESWDAFVRWTLQQGLAGLENLSGIPGCVGASPIQNIGAYGVEMRERFEGLSAVAIENGRPRDFDPAQCRFGYRDSVFKRDEAGRWLVTRVRFRLPRAPHLQLDYGEIRDELRRTGCATPLPADVAEAVRAIRRRKLPDPALIGNAGSFFKNPVVAAALADALVAAHPGMPHWPAEDGTKLSAAWMIERCGWKGFRDGDAGVHASHALVLVNHGTATGAQLMALALRVRESVAGAFGVTLEPEPAIV